MPSTLTGSVAAAIHMHQALYGAAPTATQLATYTKQASTDTSGFASGMASGFVNTGSKALALQVLTNLNITPATVTATGSYATLLAALEQIFDGYGLSARGQIILNITNLLANLEGDATYGNAAKSHNTQATVFHAQSTGTASSDGGGGGPTTGTVTLTAPVDTKTLSASLAETVLVQLGVVAGKQVDTVTLAGKYEVGDTVTLTGVATADVVYTVVAGDIGANDAATLVNVANNVAAAATGAAGSTVVGAATSLGALTLTAATAGTAFTETVTATNKALLAPVKQVDTVTLAGKYEAGDTVTLTGVATADVLYTVVAGDIGANDAATLVNVATKVAAAATGAAGSKVDGAATAAGALTLTAKTAGTAFTETVTATNKALVAPTKQVDTVTLAGKYEAGDTVTLTGVATANVVYTVLAADIGASDAATLVNVAAKVASAATGAAGSTVDGAATAAGALTLTAKTAGTGFTETVTATNKAFEAPVKQVDTITLVSGSYGIGQSITFSGIATEDVRYTLASADGSGAGLLQNFVTKLVAEINVAAGSTVDAVATGDTLTLTAKVAGTGFTVITTRGSVGPIPPPTPTKATTTPNTAGSAAGADNTQGASHVVSTPNDAGSAAGADTTQAASKVVSTPNDAGSAAGADATQAASKVVSTANVVGVSSHSTIAAMDVLTGFAIGTDKVDLLTAAGGAVAIPSALTRMADIATSASLATDLPGAFHHGVAAGAAGLVVINAGTAAGTYLFVNDANAAFSATADVFIQLVGTTGTVGAVGALTVADYFA